MAKTTRITIETDFLLVLPGMNSTRAWCPQCALEAEMITLESIGVVSNLERSALEPWLSSRDFHRSQAADGSLLICLNSLLGCCQKTKTH